MTEFRPVLNSLVEIYFPGEERGLPSRVEDISEDHLDLSAPPLPVTMSMEPGQELALFWRDKRGMFKVESRFIGTLANPHRLWRVEVISRAEKFQRRRFARAETMLNVEISFVDRDPEVTIQARAVDISEGGLRCRIPERMAMDSGEIVQVSVFTEGSAKEVMGTILRKDRVNELSEFVVVLVEPVAEEVATAFRREVFRAQRQERRTLRRMEGR